MNMQRQEPGNGDIFGCGTQLKLLWSPYKSLEDRQGVLIWWLWTTHLPQRSKVLLPQALPEEALTMAHEARLIHVAQDKAASSSPPTTTAPGT